MKIAIIFTILGIVEGIILNDWYRGKQALKAAAPELKKAVLARKK